MRYVLRPPVAQERVEQRPDGLVRIALKKAYADGTVAVDMDPLSLLCRLATGVPPPRFHTIHYAGVLAPASAWRSRIAPKPPEATPASEPETPCSTYALEKAARNHGRHDGPFAGVLVQDCLRAGLFDWGGRIFAMTSSGSSRAIPNYGPVSAPKATIEAHIRQLALELAPAGSPPATYWLTGNTLQVDGGENIVG